VLTSLAQLVGIEGNMVSFERLEQQVEGMVLDRTTTAHEVLSALQHVYNFDIIERDGQVIFACVNANDTIDIMVEDLAHGPGHEHAQVVVQRANELELPSKVVVNYIDFTRNYQSYNQYAQRAMARGKSQLHLDLPLVLDQHNAHYIAHNILDALWRRRNVYVFYLGLNHIELHPGDVVRLKSHNEKLLLKVAKMHIGRNHLVRVEAINHAHHSSAYTDGDVPFAESVIRPLRNSLM
jgi:hypothetical protein